MQNFLWVSHIKKTVHVNDMWITIFPSHNNNSNVGNFYFSVIRSQKEWNLSTTAEKLQVFCLSSILIYSLERDWYFETYFYHF